MIIGIIFLFFINSLIIRTGKRKNHNKLMTPISDVMKNPNIQMKNAITPIINFSVHFILL